MDTRPEEDVPFGPLTRHLLAPKDPRPCLIYLENCQNIILEGFGIHNSAAYTIWLLGCSHIVIQKLTVKNMHKGPNTDVLDLDCSTDVVVKECDLDAGDDCIAIKSDIFRLGRNQYSGDMLIEDCTLRSVTCGIRIGYEGDGDIKNCTFRNLKIIDSRHGINFVSITPEPWPFTKIEKGCEIYNILFENITIENSAQAIYAWTGDAGKTGTFRGSIHHVLFKNMTMGQHWGSYIGCAGETCVQDIAFENVKLTQLSPLERQAPDFIPNNWASKELGAVLTLRHVSNFTMDARSSITAPDGTILIQSV